MDFKEIKEEIEANVRVGTLAGSQSSRISCPFHKSADLDLALYHETNTWRCFGACDDGRVHNVFDWVMNIEGVPFAEAFKILADAAGISLKPNRERVEILSSAQGFYHEELMRNDEARAYLHRRGFSDEHLFRRQIGYASEGFPDGISFDRLQKVGLLRPGLTTRPFFRHRIVYPIYDRSQMQIQMQGRLFPFPQLDHEGKELPKYLGLKSDVELKGRSIWQCLAGEEILTSHSLQEVVLCEGWPDRETLDAWGIKAVSLFGHSGLSKHYHKFKTLQRVHLVLDPDGASQKNVLNELWQMGCRIPHVELFNVVLQTGGLDINDWAMSGKSEGETLSRTKDEAKIEMFQRMCKLAKPLPLTLIETWSNKPHLLQPLAQYIGRLPDPEPWVHALAKRVGETERTIRFFVKAHTPESE